MTMWLAFGVGVSLAAEVELRVVEHGTGAPILDAELVMGTGEILPVGPRAQILLDVAQGMHIWARSPQHQETELVWDDSFSSPLQVYLHPLPPPMEIVVEAFQETPHVSRHAVDAEIVLETPGALDDAVRLIQSLPGVAIQREYSPGQSQLSVRGSQPGDNLVYLDGIQIPYLYHYNQYASVIPTTQLGQLELFPSTFGVQYGNATGAVVDARTLDEAPVHLEGDASINFVMAGARLAAPLNKGWWASASGRRSFFDSAGKTSDQYPVFPRFHDFILRLDHQKAARATRFKWWGAGDGYQRAVGELDVLDPVERSQTARFDFGQEFHVLSALHEWTGDLSKGRAVWGLVQHTRRGALSGLGQEDMREQAVSHRLDLSGTGHARWAWDAGYEVRGSMTHLAVTPAEYEGLLVAEEAPSLARGQEIDARVPRLIGATYGDLHLIEGPLRVIPGVRVGLDSDQLAWMIDPRLMTRWRISSSSALKLAGGRYTQRPATEDLFRDDPTTLPTTTSLQLAGGLEQTVSGRMEFELAGYKKWLKNPIQHPVDRAAFAQPRGDAWGVELVTRYRLREIVFLWGWLGVAQSRIEEASGHTVPSDGDQRVSSGLVVSWKTEPWVFGFRISHGTGLPYTPIAGSVYDAGRDSWIPVAGQEHDARFPAYTKVDVRASHTWEFNRWSLTGSGEVWFVPPKSTALYPVWNYDWSEENFVRGPMLLPLMGMRATF
jgi:hypothetical protein